MALDIRVVLQSTSGESCHRCKCTLLGKEPGLAVVHSFGSSRNSLSPAQHSTDGLLLISSEVCERNTTATKAC